MPILSLLFGTVVVSIYLEKAHMFKYLSKLLSWKSQGGRDLLCKICIISAFSSALFTNDTTCIVLTEFVLKLAKQINLPAKPFLFALASSANVGSTTTPIGNPQNLVIVVQSKISFEKFLLGILPAMIVGIFINTGILLCIFWKSLLPMKDEEEVVDEAVVDGEVLWRGVTCDLHSKRVTHLSLANHKLIGYISSEIGKINQLKILALYGSSLYVIVPPELENFAALQNLYLQGNYSSGIIPVKYGNLSEPENLDVSSNTLSGSIPPSLAKLYELKSFNMSMNFLIGTMPSKGTLLKFGGNSYLGNSDLCGNQIGIVCRNELPSPLTHSQNTI